MYYDLKYYKEKNRASQESVNNAVNVIETRYMISIS